MTGLRRETLTAGGSPLVLRAASPADLAAALAMHARCSPQTLAQRYHGEAGEADGYLAHLLSPRHGQSVVAETAGGEVVGLGHLLEDDGESEVALLVEDGWQRLGVGTALLRALLRLAEQSHRDSVYAVTHASAAGILAVMRGLGLRVERHVAEGALVLTARLAGHPTALSARSCG
ncbi:GNAT family N-acetyltransferase [Streptomyces marincola]|uniref:GNAT family N-acetyltransferase n=1 Tax=Streptomyces marincola TaxID=2878388 RepID=UPI001CF2B0B3|nr:GNAT family N-acetyltransferase [Streptomyces marincola]UCM86636.1 GNAT family N-acetyltransferase [Streptomyces marincola]